MTAAHTWVFGYGSLVSRASFEQTLGRSIPHGHSHPAVLHGFGRRWNYASPRRRGSWITSEGAVEGGTVVCLGVAAADGETANGSVIAVSDDELAGVDRREADYDRVDVTDLVEIDGTTSRRGRVVTYVPRAAAVERFRLARAAGAAAVERRYWDLVVDAFAAFGRSALDRYHATTPVPDVPIADVAITWRRDRLPSGGEGPPPSGSVPR